MSSAKNVCTGMLQETDKLKLREESRSRRSEVQCPFLLRALGLARQRRLLIGRREGG